MKLDFFKLAFILLCIFSCSSSKDKEEAVISPDQAEARRIAKEAYIYGFPLVMNYKTMYSNVINKNSGDYKGGFNTISCEARLFSPEDKTIVTVNSDTPYCMFWSDIRNEPVIFSVPKVDDNRYYSFQFIDLYTHNFAYFGSLTTGNDEGRYLIHTKDWSGEVPKGISKSIECETGIFFTIVRTQLLDENDLPNVEQLQNKYDLQTLSEYLESEPANYAPDDQFPEWNEGDQYTANAFIYMDAMLKLIGKPLDSEAPLMNEFAKLGLGTNEGFDLERFNPEIQEAIQNGVKDGFKAMEAFIEKTSSDPLGSAKIFGTREFLDKSAKENYNLDNPFILRAVGAYLGLYGNSVTEAIYPTFLTDAEGQPMDASKFDYQLTFPPGELPPVEAFWSLTMYDGKTQLLVDNPLDRYLVNSSMIDAFIKNDDGSLTFYVQHDSPGKELENNWLPAPNGPFYCVMRLYGPGPDVVSGKWQSPVMHKTKDR